MNISPTPPRGLARWREHDQFRPCVILLTSTALMAAWWYFGSTEFATAHLAGWLDVTGNARFAAGAYEMLAAFVLMGVVPGLLVAFLHRQPLGVYGLGLGDRMRTARSALICVPAFVVAGFIASGDPAVTAEYPINRAAGDSASLFALHVGFYLLYYFGWEFTFRGYLLFGLADRLGAPTAVMIQVMASSLLHLGKPSVETFLAIPAGIFWGWIALRTRSIASSYIQHAALGISLDAFIVFG